MIQGHEAACMMLGNGSQAYFEMPGTDGNMGRLSAYRTADMKPKCGRSSSAAPS